MSSTASPAPRSIRPSAHDLNYMERLLLHALRQWVQDRARWNEVVLEFNRACGPRNATRLCEALDRLFRDLGAAARRHLRLYPPVCCHVSQDELCMLNLFATHQAGASLHADALLLLLVRESAAPRIRDSARTIALVLFETGYFLKPRTGPGRIGGGGRLLRVLH